MAYYIGLDVGTTTVKALLINSSGKILAEASREYPLSCPQPLWSEQNPEDWWQGSIACISELVKEAGQEKIIGIGLSGQMHGLVLLDAIGNILRPSILWNDQRTAVECTEITDTIGFERLMEITGNPVLPGFTAPKLAWVRKHEPAIYDNIARILLPKDYIRYRLTGEFATDVSDASGTAWLNVKKRNWSRKILDQLEISMDWMPRVYESSDITGYICPEAATFPGLEETTFVVGGGGDQAAGGVGSGTVNSGLMSIVLGTSGVVFAHCKDLRIEPEGRLHAFCHAVPNTWHLMGVTLAAAGSYQWFHDLDPLNTFSNLDQLASETPVGAEGALFLPYLSGERTPYPDPTARGTFTGLTLRHGKGHLARAVLEGVAYSIKDCTGLMADLGLSVNQARITGGGARSNLWRQIIADVLNIEIQTMTSTEGAPFGAGLLAAVAGKAFNSVEEACEATLTVQDTTAPVADNFKRYEEFYSVYQELYPALKSKFQNLAEIVAGQL